MKKQLMTHEEFRAIRLKLGLDQSQMATVLGYNAPTRISELETGMVPIARRTALLMKAFETGWRPTLIEWPKKEDAA